MVVNLWFREISTSAGYVGFYWSVVHSRVYFFLALPELSIDVCNVILKDVDVFDAPLLDRAIPVQARLFVDNPKVSPVLVAEGLEFSSPSLATLETSREWHAFAFAAGKRPKEDVRDEIKELIATLRGRVLETLNSRGLIWRVFDRVFGASNFEDAR